MADKVGDIYFSRRAKDCGMTWTTNHNKAADCGLVSQPIVSYVGHVSWQPSVATLLAASTDSVNLHHCYHLPVVLFPSK